EAARHAHVLGADVRFDLALRRQGDVAIGVDLALDLAVDPQTAGRHDVALQPCARADDRDLTVVRHLLVLSLPRGRRHVLAARRLGLVLAPDHRAAAARSSVCIACRIASASSWDRLYELCPVVTGFA